jgi:hypothetical protein
MTTPNSPKPIPPAAQQRLRARARRVTRLRRRITAAAIATFALSFGAVAATGSLGQAGSGTDVASTAQATTAAKTSTTTAKATGATSSSSASTSAATAPVTTQQS